MSAAMQIAERLYSLAKEQDDPALMIGAYRALAATRLFLGNFATRCEAWCSDLVLGTRPVSYGRVLYASRRLFVL
jgi:hypothetical protein